MNTTTLLLGDCLERMKEIPDNSVDSIVTDPPYGLGKEPDALAMLQDWIETGHHEVKGKGFMGKEWDAFVPQPLVWRECLRVLKPGGHLLAFAGTRTQDLMCLGLRLAGFEIRDMVAWVYGQGFPKSLDVSKALDKMAGAEREVVGQVVRGDVEAAKLSGVTMAAADANKNNKAIFGYGVENITEPATEAAKQWDGWGTALKPALEPITLARKPLEGTVAANVLKWHVGGLNIDGCRVKTNENLNGGAYSDGGNCNTLTGDSRNGSDAGMFQAGKTTGSEFEQPMGRWPANLIHDGSDEVVDLFPDTKSGSGNGDAKIGGVGNITPMRRGSLTPRNDHGSAARFFYAAKCSKKDRNDGLDNMKLVVLELQSCESNSTQQGQSATLLVDTEASILEATGEFGTSLKNGNEWSTVLFGNRFTEQFKMECKSTTSTATNSTIESKILSALRRSITSDCILAANSEMEGGGSHAASAESCNTSTFTISERTASALGVNHAQSTTLLKISVKDGRNIHSTVKPTDLTRYLCRLITPPNGMILDPYMGSGSTGKAAMMEGFSFAGIEQDESYFAIAETRIKAAKDHLESSNPFNL